MYALLILILLATGFATLGHGVKRRRWWEVGLGISLLVATAALFGLFSLWGEMLWFRALNFGDRFWTELLANSGLAVAGAALGAGIVWLLTWAIPRDRKLARGWPELVGAIVGGLWGMANWDLILKFWYSVPAGARDPIFDVDASFFLFALPLYQNIGSLLLLLAIIALAATAASLLNLQRVVQAAQSQSAQSTVYDGDILDELNPRSLQALQIAAGAFVLVLAWRTYIAAFRLMYSQYGVVYGPGWTDVHVRLPAYYVVAILLVLAGATFVVEALVRRARGTATTRRRRWMTASPLAAAALSWLLGLIVLPGLLQWLHVQPNEISVEQPYIEHNIRLTRQAFGLDDIEEQQFPVSSQFTPEVAKQNRDVLSQVRLWDPRALDAVYQQFQEIRLYYEFADVDIDRYTIDGQYRQVMVSPREMALENLSRQSQTFVNRRFKYTHGYGLTMAPVSEFTRDGLPNLMIKDLPPKTDSPDLAVQRPEIYYGELTDTHVIVNTSEEEFDYPSGEHNVYTRYSGDGGVALENSWRKFAFGWKFDGTRLFVSRYLTPESRVMFHRQIHDRVRTLAPFLHFDEDAYIVLDDGKLYWIVDGYTTSEYYPYSEPFLSWETTSYQGPSRQRQLRTNTADYLRGANYVRNSVKAVVDAYNGSVDFYVFEPEDPVIQVWQQIFPSLFKPREDMPESLRAHVRYPEGLLLAQGLVFARYHMTDPDVFYNQEDIWVRATEKYYANVQPVEPYYVMWQPPDGAEEMQFILMQPFTPKNRQVLIGWIAGMCDGENYGRLLAYRFPKEKRVLGTQQVETKIDQDPFLSQQLSLWDQRGSRVVRGNVLAIPVADTLLYVEPIYLQADAAAYPELRMVVLMHDDRLSYGQTFDEALAGLYADGQPRAPSLEPAPPGGTFSDLVRRAGDAFDGYLQALGDKEFETAGRHLEELSTALRQLEQSDEDSSAAAGDPTEEPN